MSTPCELILYTQNKQQADSTAQAVLLESKRLEKKYSYYRDDSILSQINSRSTQTLDSETKSILQRAKKYYSLTNGIFDITIATIKNLYRDESDELSFQRKKEELEPFIGCEHFSIKKDKIIFDNEYTKIDLGGFVKEYAVDRAVIVIKKHKITSALINFGGDIYALGKKPDGRLFSIGIKDPLNPGKYATDISIENQALTTSASYERNYTIGSRTYSHIISKDESDSKPNSVTVVSSNCVESGIYSTSIMIDKDLETKNRVFVL